MKRELKMDEIEGKQKIQWA
jgi:hypothetical protein